MVITERQAEYAEARREAYEASRQAREAVRQATGSRGMGWRVTTDLWKEADKQTTAKRGTPEYYRQMAQNLSKATTEIQAGSQYKTWGGTVEENIQGFADKYGLSLEQATKLLSNPNSPEWKQLDTIAKYEATRLSQVDPTPHMQQKAYEKVKEYIKVGRVTPENPSGIVGFDLRSAVKAGITDPSTYKLAQPFLGGIKITRSDITRGGMPLKSPEDLKRMQELEIAQDISKEISELPKELQLVYKKSGGNIEILNTAIDNYNKEIIEERKKYEQEVLPTLPREIRALYDLSNETKMDRFDKAIDVHNAKIEAEKTVYDNAINKLSNYQDEEGNYRVAKYLRDNPNDYQTLIDANFKQTDIDKAEDFNRINFGIGAPELMTEREYIKQYFKDNNWKYVTRGTITSVKDLERLEQAKEAYDKNQAPTVSLQQYQANIFNDNGWKILDLKTLKPTPEDDKRLAEFNKRTRLVTDEYAKKFGSNQVLSQGVTNLADFVIPGLYLTKNWEKLPDSDRALNIAIDAVFVATLFGRPISSSVRSVLVKSYGVGSKLIEKTATNIAQATNRANVQALRQEAMILKKLGESMKLRGIAGADNIINKSTQIVANANRLASLGKLPTPKSVRTALKEIGNLAKTVASGEAGFIKTSDFGKVRGVTYQKQLGSAGGIITVKQKPIVKVSELTRAEAEAQQKMWGEIEDVLIKKQASEELLKEADEIIKKASKHTVGEPDPTSSSFRPTKELTPEIEKLMKEYSSARSEAERHRLAKEISEKIKDHARKVAGTDKGKKVETAPGTDMPTDKEREIVARNKAYLAWIEALAKEQLAQIKQMQIKHPNYAISSNASLVISATKPELLRTIINNVDTRTATNILASLSKATIKAYSSQNLNRVKALSKAKLMQLSSTLTSTESLAMQSIKNKSKQVIKPLSTTKAKQLQEELTKIQAKPIEKLGTKFKAPPEEKIGDTIKKPPPPDEPPRKKKKVKPKFLIEEAKKKKRRKLESSIIAWRQGFVIHVTEKPFKTVKSFHYKHLPEKYRGVKIFSSLKQALKRISVITGKPPKRLEIDMGIMDVIIKGRQIAFRHDPKQRTVGSLKIGKKKVIRKKNNLLAGIV